MKVKKQSRRTQNKKNKMGMRELRAKRIELPAQQHSVDPCLSNESVQPPLQEDAVEEAPNQLSHVGVKRRKLNHPCKLCADHGLSNSHGTLVAGQPTLRKAAEKKPQNQLRHVGVKRRKLNHPCKLCADHGLSNSHGTLVAARPPRRKAAEKKPQNQLVPLFRRNDVYQANQMVERYLFVQHTTIFDVVRGNLDLPVKEVSLLLFKAICKKKCVKLKYTKRLKDQLKRLVDTFKSEFKLVSPYIWPCTVHVANFVSFKQFQQIYSRENVAGPICDGQSEGLDGYVKTVVGTEQTSLKGVGDLRKYGKRHTILNVPLMTVLDVVRQNLNQCAADLDDLVLDAICREKSVQLKFTKMLKYRINGYAKTIKRKFVVRNNVMVYHPFQVLESDFVNKEKYLEMTEEMIREVTERPSEIRTSGRHCKRGEEYAKEKYSSQRDIINGVTGHQSTEGMREDIEAGHDPEEIHSHAETYLYIDWFHLRSMMKRNGWGLTSMAYNILIFKLICEANSVPDLIHTSRLTYQIVRFVNKLSLKYRTKLADKKQFWSQLDDSPPWACKILASEFGNQDQYRRICQENEKNGPHPRWTEFEDLRDFDVPFGVPPIEDQDRKPIVVKTEQEIKQYVNQPLRPSATRKKVKKKKELLWTKKWVQCDVCDWKFRKPTQFLLHSKWHEYVCCHCGVSYTNEPYRRVHIKNKHPYTVTNKCMCQANTDKWLTYKRRKIEDQSCPECDNPFGEIDELEDHVTCAAYFTRRSRRYCCMCYKGCVSETSLIKHKQYFHSTSQKYVCFRCKYCMRYINPQQVKWHVDRHEKKYKRFWVARSSENRLSSK